jgi:hypothetical protein
VFPSVVTLVIGNVVGSISGPTTPTVPVTVPSFCPCVDMVRDATPDTPEHVNPGLVYLSYYKFCQLPSIMNITKETQQEG